MNRNPLPIVSLATASSARTDSLTGYAGGLDRKEALLRLEGAIL